MTGPLSPLRLPEESRMHVPMWGAIFFKMNLQMATIKYQKLVNLDIFVLFAD